MSTPTNDAALSEAEREAVADSLALYDTVAHIKADAIAAERARVLAILDKKVDDYDEEPHSEECGWDACVRCVVDGFATLRNQIGRQA